MVSEVRLGRLVRRLVQLGAVGLVVSSDTGEFWNTGINERKTILEWVIRDSQNQIGVLAHVSSLSTSVSLDLAQHAARHGARGAVLMPPYYGKITDEEVIGFVTVIANYADLEIILVDPMHRLSDEMELHLKDVPGVTIAQSLRTTAFADAAASDRTASDDFAVGDAWVSTTALMLPQLPAQGAPSPAVKALAGFVRQLGGAKVAKAAFNCLDFEVGQLRGPQNTVQGHDLELLNKVMATV